MRMSVSIRSAARRSFSTIHRLASQFGTASVCALLAVLSLAFFAAPAQAQKPLDLGFTYTQERTKFVGSSPDDYFRLRGASINVGYSIWNGLGIFADATGMAATNQRNVIDIHQATFIVGPRYTYNVGHITPTAWGRKSGIFFEGGVGYTIATSGYYPVGGALSDHSSALSYLAGGGINLHLYHRLDLRLIEADVVQTKLPNGGNNTQNNIRYGTGISFHLGN
jgi:hypothetical protein